MRVKDVFVLNDVELDLENGRKFYDDNESGVGDFFWDSLLAYVVAVLPVRRNPVWIKNKLSKRN